MYSKTKKIFTDKKDTNMIQIVPCVCGGTFQSNSGFCINCGADRRAPVCETCGTRHAKTSACDKTKIIEKLDYEYWVGFRDGIKGKSKEMRKSELQPINEEGLV